MITITLDFVLDGISEIDLAQLLNSNGVLILEVVKLQDPHADLTLKLKADKSDLRNYLIEYYGETEETVDSFISEYGEDTMKNYNPTPADLSIAQDWLNR